MTTSITICVVACLGALTTHPFAEAQTTAGPPEGAPLRGPASAQTRASRAISQLRASLVPGSPAAVDQICRLLADPDTRGEERELLVPMLLDVAKGRDGVERMIVWLDEWLINRHDATAPPSSSDIEALIDALASQDRIVYATASTRGTVMVFREMVKTGGVHAGWLRLYGAAGASHAKSEAAVKIIVARPKQVVWPRELILSLDDIACAKLRELTPVGTPPFLFHVGAASALADLGDIQLPAMLDRAVARGVGDRRQDELVEAFKRMVIVQRTEDDLLRCIAEDDLTALNQGLRLWAIVRATERGIAPERIADALARFKANVEAELFTEQPNSVRARQVVLREVKRRAISLGVLEADSWQDVQLTSSLDATPRAR